MGVDGRRMQAASGRPVVPRGAGEGGEGLRHGRIALRRLPGLDGPGRGFRVPAAKQVGADATDHQPAETAGSAAATRRSRLAPIEKPMASTGPVAGRALMTSCSSAA